jgi:peroxiredoxin
MAVTKGRTSTASTSKTLAVGDEAPDFTLAAQNSDEKFTLSSMRGKKHVVIAFYPFAFTPV